MENKLFKSTFAERNQVMTGRLPVAIVGKSGNMNHDKTIRL
jgi:hypothetical protein